MTPAKHKLCLVELDFMDLLLTAEKGLQLMKLLQEGAVMSAEYSRGSYHDTVGPMYIAKPLKRFNLTMLMDDQVIAVAREPATPKRSPARKAAAAPEA